MHHESSRTRQDVQIGSDRSFGFVFTVVSLVAAYLAWPIVWGTVLLGCVAALFLLVALVRPLLLHPLNIVWMRFGHLLQRVVQPLVLALFFFVIFTPYALTRKVFGRGPIDVSFNERATTYWRVIDHIDEQQGSMRDQF